MNRAGWLTALAMGALSAGTVAAAASTPRAPACGPASAHTLAADAAVRVYESAGDVFGCARGRPGRKLGNARFCNNSNLIAPVRVAGDLAAYGDETCGVDTGSTSVIVRRLTNERRLAERPATTGPGLVESYQAVTSLVLEPDGAVAWIGTERSIVGHGYEVEVHSLVGGRFSLLDSGAGIAPGSLRLGGSTLSWRDGKSVRTARL